MACTAPEAREAALWDLLAHFDFVSAWGWADASSARRLMQQGSVHCDSLWSWSAVLLLG